MGRAKDSLVKLIYDGVAHEFVSPDEYAKRVAARTPPPKRSKLPFPHVLPPFRPTRVAALPDEPLVESREEMRRIEKEHGLIPLEKGVKFGRSTAEMSVDIFKKHRVKYKKAAEKAVRDKGWHPPRKKKRQCTPKPKSKPASTSWQTE